MPTGEPYPESAEEPAEGSRDNVAPDAKRATDARSGHDRGEKNSDQTLKHPGREEK